MKKLLVILFFVLLLFSIIPFAWSAPSSQGTIPDLTPTPTPIVTATPLAVLEPEEKGSGIGATSGNCYRYRCEDFCKLKLKWGFTWGGGVRTDCECDGVKIDPVYMISWIEKVDGRDISAYSKWLLTFNEPDLKGNGETHPTVAATIWYIIDNMYPDKYLISPSLAHVSVPNCYWGDSVPNATCYWLDDFVSEFVRLFGRQPRINALGGHCYGYWGLTVKERCVKMVTYLKTKAEELDVSGGIWINEYGPGFNDQEIMNERLQEATSYLVTEPSVVRYAPWNLRLDGIWRPHNTMQCYGHELTAYGEIIRDTQLYKTYAPATSR